jgi:hypothetical protein
MTLHPEHINEHSWSGLFEEALRKVLPPRVFVGKALYFKLSRGGIIAIKHPERNHDKPWAVVAPFCAAIDHLPFDEWSETFGTKHLTGGLLDRLTHHVHILEMNDESYRLNQSRKQRKSPKRWLEC